MENPELLREVRPCPGLTEPKAGTELRSCCGWQSGRSWAVPGTGVCCARTAGILPVPGHETCWKPPDGFLAGSPAHGPFHVLTVHPAQRCLYFFSHWHLNNLKQMWNSFPHGAGSHSQTAAGNEERNPSAPKAPPAHVNCVCTPSLRLLLSCSHPCVGSTALSMLSAALELSPPCGCWLLKGPLGVSYPGLKIFKISSPAAVVSHPPFLTAWKAFSLSLVQF